VNGVARGRPVIAIDGPAGSGKSTLSRALSERLGLDRLDTGAMYRAVTWAALDRGIDPSDRGAVAELARGLEIMVAERVTADGADVTEAIRGPEVNAAVSVVAANPDVRAVLVDR
jgi:CMP/dCMP kinase